MKNRETITTPSITDIVNQNTSNKHSSWKKWLLTLVVLTVVGALTWNYVNQSSSPKQAVYQTVSVNRGDLTVSVTATGNLEPVNQVDIGTELSGTVEKVFVDNNDVVKKGQELARLDTDQLEDTIAKNQAALKSAESKVAQAKAQITQAAANVLQANASVSQTEANALQANALVEQAKATTLEARTHLNRLQQLNKSSNGKLPAKGDLDTAIASWKRALAAENAAKASAESAKANISGTKASAESIKAEQLNAQANLESAEAGVLEAKATLRSSQTNLQKAIITSPIDGVVLDRAVESGQTVAASLSAPTLFTLAEDLSKMELEVSVDEADVGQVKEGQVANFTVDAWPGRNYPAEITRVSLGSTLTDNVVSYLTELAVTNTDLTLRPGMTATATIITQSRKNAMLIPNTALRFKPDTQTNGSASEKRGAKSSSDGGILSKLMPGPRFPRQQKRKGTEETTTLQKSEQTIWILEGGTPKPIKIKTGITDGKNTEVVAGDLTPDMQIITASSEASK
jgi:HlyD family secretion protein